MAVASVIYSLLNIQCAPQRSKSFHVSVEKYGLWRVALMECVILCYYCECCESIRSGLHEFAQMEKQPNPLNTYTLMSEHFMIWIHFVHFLDFGWWRQSRMWFMSLSTMQKCLIISVLINETWVGTWRPPFRVVIDGFAWGRYLSTLSWWHIWKVWLLLLTEGSAWEDTIVLFICSHIAG